MSKRCPKCGDRKSLNEFYTPVAAYCKPCTLKYQKSQRPARKESEENACYEPRVNRYDIKLSAQWLRTKLSPVRFHHV